MHSVSCDKLCWITQAHVPLCNCHSETVASYDMYIACVFGIALVSMWLAPLMDGHMPAGMLLFDIQSPGE